MPEIDLKATAQKRPIGKRVALALATALLALATALSMAVSVEAAGASAVIVMYHRFGEPAHPSTNITVEQVDAHIAELITGGYSVLPMPEIVARVASGEMLPDRTVGITIDDAYRSVFFVAWPRFRAADLPFTVFISTTPLDQGLSNYMSWDQVRVLAASGVTIGHHTATHLHMAAATFDRNRREIEGAFQRYEKELNLRPTLFAYPYGETSKALSEFVESVGFKAAFGQHSGVIGSIGDMFYLPRFAMNEKYGSIERFRLAVNALPLPVTDVTPVDHLITSPNPPAMGFTVKDGIAGLDRLACFASQEGRATLERLGPTRIEIRVKQPFPKGRSRVNCTLRTKQGRWRWLGWQYYRAP